MSVTIDSNKTSLSYAAETSLKTLPANPTWYPLEPNSYANFGGDLKTTPREPITATRQRAKGTVTDLDVTAGFTSDMTQNNATRLLQGFFFAQAREKFKTQPLNGTAIAITSVAVGAFGAGAGLGGVPVGSIVLSKGFSNPANNTVSRVSAAAAGSLTVASYLGGEAASALVAEAAPPVAASLEVVGHALTGDVLLYPPGSTFNGAVVVQALLSSAATLDFTTLGLIPGEWVYLGDADDVLGDAGATDYNFAGTGAVRNRGYCRIGSISAHEIVFDLSIGSDQWAQGAGAGGSCAIAASDYVSLYFGTVIRNEPVPANIVRTSYTLQRYLGKNATNVDELEYVSGAIPNELILGVPSNSKITTEFTFVGMDTEQANEAQLPGVYEALVSESPFNTSQDVYALLLYKINAAQTTQAPLFAYATDEKLTVNNNVKPNKAIGVVGAVEGNVGNFDVSGSLTCYFDDIAAQQAVRANADVGLTNIFAKQNAGFILDLPLLTIALPGLKVEKDKPITADISHTAAPGANDYTLLYNTFAYLPASAMADSQ